MIQIFWQFVPINSLVNQVSVMPNTMIFWTTCRKLVTLSAGNRHLIHFTVEQRHIWRYGLYDFEYEHQCQGTTDSSKKQKLFLMSWCPDRWVTLSHCNNTPVKTTFCSAKIKKKMLYSSSFDALKKSLVGVHKYIQATDSSEASEESVEKQLRSTDRV